MTGPDPASTAPTSTAPTGAGPADGTPASAGPTGAGPASAGPADGTPADVDRSGWRRSVRVICLDPSDRILLLHWRDPVDGRLLWEPPGGGIDPGEDEDTAGRREVLEETGITVTLVPGRRVLLHRVIRWCGRIHTGEEPFLLARVPATPEVRPAALTADEDGAFLEGRWLTWTEVLALTDLLEPPDLRDVLRALEPAGPWR